MTTGFRMWRLAPVIAIVALIASPAHARQVRVPETGYPALTIEVPDDWTTGPRPGGFTGGVMVRPPERTAGVQAYIVEASMPPEATAGAEINLEINGVPVKAQATTISGLRAFRFGYTQEQDGMTLTMSSIRIIVDDGHVANVSTMTTGRASSAVKAQVSAILESAKVVTAPNEKGEGQ